MVDVPTLGSELEGSVRPGHFAGVATVVTKLFNIVQPDRAYFGEKDFQQLQIIRRMVEDLAQPVDVIGVATVREADGLACSSRNVYLTTEERRAASIVPKALDEAERLIANGVTDVAALEKAICGFHRHRTAGTPGSGCAARSGNAACLDGNWRKTGSSVAFCSLREHEAAR